jgi:hypothetical protein
MSENVVVSKDVLQQALEPVAWRYKKEGGGIFVSDQCPADVEVWNDIEWSKPLFTAPPRREWHSLTDADFDSICDNHSTLQGAARAIEAALRSKNQ